MLIKSEHAFAIASSLERVIRLCQYFLAESFMVVDLTVDDGGNGLGRVMERLVAGRGQIVDAQACAAESCAMISSPARRFLETIDMEDW